MTPQPPKCACCGKDAPLHPAFVNGVTGEILWECEGCDPPSPSSLVEADQK